MSRNCMLLGLPILYLSSNGICFRILESILYQNKYRPVDPLSLSLLFSNLRTLVICCSLHMKVLRTVEACVKWVNSTTEKSTADRFCLFWYMSYHPKQMSLLMKEIWAMSSRCWASFKERTSERHPPFMAGNTCQKSWEGWLVYYSMHCCLIMKCKQEPKMQRTEMQKQCFKSIFTVMSTEMFSYYDYIFYFGKITCETSCCTGRFHFWLKKYFWCSLILGIKPYWTQQALLLLARTALGKNVCFVIVSRCNRYIDVLQLCIN